MVAVKWTNEKGNVAVKVRDGVRAQVKEKALAALADAFEGAVENANGGISFPVATDTVSGDTIYAHFEMIVSTKTPDTKTERKKKAKATPAEEVVVPNLFDDPSED